MLKRAMLLLLALPAVFVGAYAKGASGGNSERPYVAERVFTQQGSLIIRYDDFRYRLLLNGRVLIQPDFDYLSIKRRVRQGSRDVFLIERSYGGSHGCQGKFLVLELTHKRAPKLSPWFGTCASPTRTRVNGPATFVEMPLWRQLGAHERPPMRYRAVKYVIGGVRLSREPLKGWYPEDYFNDCWQAC